MNKSSFISFFHQRNIATGTFISGCDYFQLPVYKLLFSDTSHKLKIYMNGIHFIKYIMTLNFAANKSLLSMLGSTYV